MIDACIAYIDNNDIDIEGLMQYVKAPDFPTGGYIYGISGVRDAYETGRGRVVMRAKAEIETHTSHDKIIVNEIPYNVNKKELIENIASLVNEKKIDGISYVMMSLTVKVCVLLLMLSVMLMPVSCLISYLR